MLAFLLYDLSYAYLASFVSKFKEGKTLGIALDAHRTGKILLKIVPRVKPVQGCLTQSGYTLDLCQSDRTAIRDRAYGFHFGSVDLMLVRQTDQTCWDFYTAGGVRGLPCVRRVQERP